MKVADLRQTLATLDVISHAGGLRRVDVAFAGFVAEIDPRATAPVVVVAALVAQMEGRGHSCLQLDDLIGDPVALLGWPAAAIDAWQALLRVLPRKVDGWCEALRRSTAVAVDGDEPGPRGPAAASTRDWIDEDAEPHPGSPLVMRGNRVYLRRYWRHERDIAEQVLARAATVHRVDVAAARGWLDRLFPPPAGAAADRHDWQKFACAVALRAGLSIVTGGPGTGKTHTAARLLALLFAVAPEPDRLRIALAAPTGKAAARLKQAIAAALVDLRQRLGDDALPWDRIASRTASARTLHALLGARPDTRRLRHDAAHPLEVDVLIVDEASMVHLEMMSSLLAALPPTARLVLLGDKDQLSSVEAGAVLGDLCRVAGPAPYDAGTAAWAQAMTGQALPPETLGDGPPLAQQTVMLRESRRFGGPIGELAFAVNRGDDAAAAALLKNAATQMLGRIADPTPAAVVRLAIDGRDGAAGSWDGYLRALADRPAGDDARVFDDWVRRVLGEFDAFRLLCAHRVGTWGAAGLNAAIESALAASNRLATRGSWYEGRPVMVTRNDAALGVFNGDIGIALRPAAAGSPLRVWFSDGDRVRSVASSRLAMVETAFAMTVHKSQGSEFEHAVLVLPDEASRVLTRELVYTAVTRARQSFTLVAPRAESWSEALAQRTRRASGLPERLGAGGDRWR